MSRQQGYAGKSATGYGYGSSSSSRGGTYSGGKGGPPPSAPQSSRGPPPTSRGPPPSRTSYSNPPPPTSTGPPPLTVSGCRNATVENIIKGQYVSHGTNHEKPVYKKEAIPGNASVLIYFWDERDGPSFSGWWFGPKVGGDQVWGYNGSKHSATPPPSGWQVPWDGAVDDSLRLSGTSSSKRGSDHAHPPPSSGRSPSIRQEDRRREADRQRQHAEQQKEQQRRDEERRQRQRQKEREDEQARRAAELRRKKEQEEEENRRREQTAALAVRKVIQKVRVATPENFDSLSAELQKEKKLQHYSMGAQADKVAEECTKALQQARQRVDEMVRKKKQEEREREEEERRRKEEAERIDRLLKLADEDVTATEAKVQEAVEGGKLVQDATGPAETEVADLQTLLKKKGVVELADAAEKMIDSARSVVEVSMQKLSDHKKDMGGGGSAHRARSDLGGLEARLASGRQTLDTVFAAVQASRSKALRKSAALKKREEEKQRFAKFDQDNDGKWSREEVVSFAVKEYGFDLPAAILDSIMLQLEPVSLDKFHKVQVKVGVAMLEAKERVRRAEEEEKKRVLEEQRTRMQTVIDEVAELVTTVERHMSDAEKESKLLQNLKASSDIEVSDILTAVSATEDVQKQVADVLASAAEKIKSVEDECSSTPALKGFDKKDLPRLQSRHARVASRSDKVTSATKNAGEVAVRKAYLDIEQVRGQFVKACRAFMGEKEMTGEQFFAHVCKEGEAITVEQFDALLAELSISDVENKKEKLFKQITGTEPEISKCTFAELIRFFYKCVKATLVTEELGIKSKTIRRLEVGEVLEAVEGPMKEGGAGVQRAKCRAVGDGATGWVTIAGNQGTPFLEPGGNMYMCVHETVLSDAMSVQDSKTLRRLDKGEEVEVLEFSKKDEVVGVTRVKGKAKRDGVTGWVTLVGNQGTAYLEAC